MQIPKTHESYVQKEENQQNEMFQKSKMQNILLKRAKCIYYIVLLNKIFVC